MNRDLRERIVIPVTRSHPTRDVRWRTLAAVALPRQTLASFLTWRTYGTWLPGDERGWVDERRNGIGERMNLPDARLEWAVKARMRDKPVALDEVQRTIVGAAIQERSARRGWHVLAFNVRTNHVHVVVSSEADPKAVLNELKIAGTMALRAAGKATPESRIWARGGSARPVKGRRALDAVVDYVLNRQ